MMGQTRASPKPHEDGIQNQSNPVSPNKVLNVSVPASTYWHIRRCASESRMSVKAFMAKFCRTATPIQATEADLSTEADQELLARRNSIYDHN